MGKSSFSPQAQLVHETRDWKKVRYRVVQVVPSFREPRLKAWRPPLGPLTRRLSTPGQQAQATILSCSCKNNRIGRVCMPICRPHFGCMQTAPTGAAFVCSFSEIPMLCKLLTRLAPHGNHPSQSNSCNFVGCTRFEGTTQLTRFVPVRLCTCNAKP